MATSEKKVSTNWQSGLSLADCNKYMLNNQIECDVKILVGKEPNPELIPAHKFVLASRSSVMFAMFFRHMAETGTIRITDVKANIFKDFLMYLYTDQVTLTGDNVCHLMYTANKYDVGSLIKMCAEFLKKNIQMQNVCSIMENAHSLGVEDLVSSCCNFIVHNFSAIFRDNDLNKLCSDCLEKIISADDLAENETVVFNAVLTWAENCCKKQDLPLTKMNKRQVLGKLLFQVRFPLMTAEEFSNVADSDILTQEEQIKIFKNLARGQVVSNVFPCKPRLIKPREMICLRTLRKNYADVDENYKVIQSITINVSQKVKANGLLLFLPNANQPRNEVMVNISDTKGVILQENGTFGNVSVNSNNILKLYFKNPVMMATSLTYVVKITLKINKVIRSPLSKRRGHGVWVEDEDSYTGRALKLEITPQCGNTIQENEKFNKQLGKGVVVCHGVQFTFSDNDITRFDSYTEGYIGLVIKDNNAEDLLRGLIFSK